MFCPVLAKLNYHKNFYINKLDQHVTLFQHIDNENNIIIHGESDEHSLIAPLHTNIQSQSQSQMNNNIPMSLRQIEMNRFIKSLRGILTPLQLCLLLDLINTMSISSEIVSNKAEQILQNKLKQNTKNNNVNINSNSSNNNIAIITFELKIYHILLLIL